MSLTIPKALMWTLTASAILLTGGRYAIRYTKCGRFYYDDLTHGMAMVCLIAFSAVGQEWLALARGVLDTPSGTPPMDSVTEVPQT